MGFELSVDNVAFANSHGLNVSDSPFLKVKIKSNSMDCVYMSHVFEHLYKPVETMSKIHKTLKSGGICYCEVPNIDCYWHELSREAWPWLDERAHLFHYTPKTLSGLFKKIGFSLVDVHTYTSKDPSTSPLNNYMARYPAKTTEQLLCDTAELAKNMRGECLVIIARKE
jgi:predicted SAM-dependent methyltransferase